MPFADANLFEEFQSEDDDTEHDIVPTLLLAQGIRCMAESMGTITAADGEILHKWLRETIIDITMLQLVLRGLLQVAVMDGELKFRSTDASGSVEIPEIYDA